MIRWGVRVEGSSVLVCADGPSAFREEARRRMWGLDAQACWSDGGGWHLVQWGSNLRADPMPPGPRHVWWWERALRLPIWRQHSVKSRPFWPFWGRD